MSARGPSLPSVLFLLDAAPLFGGTKVVLRQADLLHRRGHDVQVAIAGELPRWYEGAAPLVRVSSLQASDLPRAEIVVATYWTTIDAARRAAGERAAHYCQGFEFLYTHNVSDHERITALYSAPLPALAVSEHLARELRSRFARPARVVAQPLEPWFAPARRWRPAGEPTILVCGPFEIDWKGVATSLAAVKRLRQRGLRVRLARLSQWPLTAQEEELLTPDEFHCHLTPRAASALFRRCDLLLAPSWEQEGFGLPALEAMASGVPVVASDVACYRGWTEDAAVRVPADDPAAVASAAAELLADPRRWRAQRRRGFRLARRYREHEALRSIEHALAWIADGSWRAAAR